MEEARVIQADGIAGSGVLPAAAWEPRRLLALDGRGRLSPDVGMKSLALHPCCGAGPCCVLGSWDPVMWAHACVLMMPLHCFLGEEVALCFGLRGASRNAPT